MRYRLILAVSFVLCVLLISGFEQTTVAQAALGAQASTGTLQITSNPSGAVVIVGAAIKGTTPLTLEVAEGDYALILRMRPQYEENHSSVRIVAAQTTKAHRELAPLGIIYATSDPPGASVTPRFGLYMGTTPGTMYLSPDSKYVTFEKNNYGSVTLPVKMWPSQTTAVFAKLAPLPPSGELAVTISPAEGTALFIDDELAALYSLSPIINGAIIIKGVRAGTRQIKILKMGYHDYVTNVEVVPDQTTQLRAVLVPARNGTLYITSNPTGSLVNINYERRGRTPLLVNATEGTRTLLAYTSGYATNQTTANVIADKTSNVHFELLPLSTVSIYSKPDFANLYINNEFKGTTQPGGEWGWFFWNVVVTSPQVFDIKITKPYYNEITEKVTINLKEAKTLYYTLTPKPIGVISATSNPSGAFVYVDGEIKGETNINIPAVDPGTRQVKFVKTGYETITSSVSVVAGGTAKVNANLVAIPPGKISATSAPSGAEVYVDGVLKGVSPVTISNVDVGSRVVTFSKYNYVEYVVPVNVVSYATASVHAVLVPVGQIYATSDPAGATVYVDGAYKANTPVTIAYLEPGNRQVKFVKTGYGTVTAGVNVVSGGTASVNVVLVPLGAVPGSVSAVSSPSGADVYIDGVLKGVSPVTVSNVVPGSRLVKMVKVGFDDYSTTVNVVSGGTASVNAVLVPVAGSISAGSTPVGASVYVDGVLKGVSPVVIPSVVPGSRVVKFVMVGFDDYSTTVNVVSGAAATVNAVLVPVAGSISAGSTPVGASVYVDGVLKGVSPVVVPNVVPGSRVVKFVKAGYADYSTTVSVVSGATASVNAVLNPVAGSISAGSTPSGADVYIDGVLKGVTPVVVSNVAVGSRVVKFVKAGYDDYSVSVNVVSGGTATVSAVLSAVPGSISASSTPSGADVYVDGVLKGVSPVVIPNVAVGSRLVKMVKVGFDDYSTTVNVVSGATASVNAVLVPVTGSISASSTPSGAEVYIDGVLKGMSPVTVSGVAVGNRAVKLVKVGYDDYSTTVNVVSGATASVSPVLSAVPAPNPFDVTDCGDLTDSGKVYNLVNDIADYTPGVTCIDIKANNVIFDCHGYNINGSTSGVTTGIAINRPDYVRISNITIKNCNITNWYGGIVVMGVGALNNTIINNTITGAGADSDAGINLRIGSGNNTVINNTVSGTADDIELLDSSNNYLANDTSKSASAYGVVVTGTSLNNTFINVQAFSAAGSDYYLSSLSSSNYFSLGNFTEARRIRFVDAKSVFNYNDNSSNNVWLKTNVSTATTVTRTTSSWGRNQVQWTDSGSLEFGYTLTGLLPSTSYSVFNGTDSPAFILSADTNGNLPFVIFTDGTSRTITVNLAALPTGKIYASSTPSGADVYVDGFLKGVSPVVVPNVAPGSRVVKFVKASYADYSISVNVVSGGTATVSAVLSAVPGSISASSTPSGAAVYVDGVLKGTSPVTVSNVAVGSRVVKFVKAGYVDYSVSVSVVSGGTATVNAVLVPSPGSINAGSTPVGAAVYVDGVLKGTSPVTVSNVVPGSRLVKFVKAGYADYSTTVSVVSGGTATVNAVLVPVGAVGSVSAVSVPSRAEVYVDGVYKGVSPVTVSNVAVGYRVVKFVRAGYDDYSTTVNVVAGGTKYMRVVLTSVTAIGSVSASSSPSGASVFVDGVLKGVTPVVVPNVAPGNRLVKFVKTGYDDYTTSVSVVSGAIATVNAVLNPVAGSISASSTPSDANVYVDGVLKGVTGVSPLIIPNVAVGNRLVKFVKAGYADYSVSANVVSGGTASVNAVLVALTKGTVNATSSPSGAYVYVDNLFKGFTPRRISGVAVGTRQVKLVKTGYNSFTTSVNVVGGKIVSVNAVLEAQPKGTIYATSIPSEAYVYVDNMFKGVTPITISDVVASTRRVKFVKTGYNTYVTSADVVEGKTTDVQGTLTPN